MKSNSFTVISMCLGVVSIMTCPLIFVSFPMAGLAIIFAVLSKGDNRRMELMPKAGIAASVVGLVLTTTLYASLFMLIVYSPTYRDMLNATSKQMYGISLDEQFEQRYGFTMEDLSERFIGLTN